MQKYTWCGCFANESWTKIFVQPQKWLHPKNGFTTHLHSWELRYSITGCQSGCFPVSFFWYVIVAPGGVDHHPQLRCGSCRKKSRFQVPSSEGFTGLAATLIKTCPGCKVYGLINFGAGGAGKSIIPVFFKLFQENSHTLRNHEQLWLATPTHQLGRRVHETELEHIDILEPIKWPLASCHCVPITLSKKNHTQESRNGWLDKHGRPPSLFVIHSHHWQTVIFLYRMSTKLLVHLPKSKNIAQNSWLLN